MYFNGKQLSYNTCVTTVTFFYYLEMYLSILKFFSKFWLLKVTFPWKLLTGSDALSFKAMTDEQRRKTMLFSVHAVIVHCHCFCSLYNLRLYCIVLMIWNCYWLQVLSLKPETSGNSSQWSWWEFITSLE